MLNLIKYEFKKNKFSLCIMGLIFLLLEGVYLYGCIVSDQDIMAAGAGFMVMYVMVAFFYVMYVGINNYEKDLTQKCGYLVYMTPNSSLKLIFSKFLYVLVVGVTVCVVMGGIGIMDLALLAQKLNEEFNLLDIVRGFMDAMGFDLDGVLIVILLEVIAFVIDFFSILAVAYFAITLTATVLNNSKLRGFISTVLILVMLFGISWFGNKYISSDIEYVHTLKDAFLYLLPEIIYSAVITAVGVIGSAYLTEKAISL